MSHEHETSKAAYGVTAGGQVSQGGEQSSQLYGQMGAQSGVQGPNMGQPHFSAQLPGQSPYLGAPIGAPFRAPQAGAMPLGQGMYGQPYYGQAEASFGQAYLGQPLLGQPFLGQPFQGQFFQGQAGQAPQGAPYSAQQAGGFAQQAPLYGQYYGGQQPNGAQAPASGAEKNPGQGQGKENRYGELYGLIQEAANGHPDVNKFLTFFNTTSADFWKGALIGAGLTLLLTSDTVKSTVAKSMSGVLGLLGMGAAKAEEEEDRRAEERAAQEVSS